MAETLAERACIEGEMFISLMRRVKTLPEGRRSQSKHSAPDGADLFERLICFAAPGQGKGFKEGHIGRTHSGKFIACKSRGDTFFRRVISNICNDRKHVGVTGKFFAPRSGGKKAALPVKGALSDALLCFGGSVEKFFFK